MCLIHRDGLTVTSRQVADKRRMTVATADGTREVEVPRLLRSRPTLTEEQIIEGARLGLALEAALGWPVDVECAWGGGRLSLLQCRPITTLRDATATGPSRVTHAPSAARPARRCAGRMRSYKEECMSAIDVDPRVIPVP